MQIYFQFAEPKGLPIFESITNGVNLTNKYIKMSLYMFKNMITKKDTSALGGPIAIISETAKSVNQGFKIFLLLLAMISVSLAIINLIPLPILDGGQALIYTIEAVIRRKFTEKTKEIIFMISWGFMLVLFVLISTRDIWNIIKVYFIKK
jgi:regulator of sigma E protease